MAQKTKMPTVTAVCQTCVEYAEENGLLYPHGASYRHVGNDRERCPGQEDDDTDDRATPMTFELFAERFGPEDTARILTAHMRASADRAARPGQ